MVFNPDGRTIMTALQDSLKVIFVSNLFRPILECVLSLTS